MTDEELLGVVKAHERASLGSSASSGAVTGMAGVYRTDAETLEIERAQAMDYYHGRPLGNEQEGRSQVVSQDVRDTVEWIMPQLMRMFVGSDDTLSFEPEGPEDEAICSQETEVVNYFMRKSDGFLVLHDFAKDGLLLKNGYVKAWWEEKTCETFEDYSGLTMDELQLIVQNAEQSGDKVEFASADQAEDGTLKVKLKRIKQWGEPKAECIAPEDMRVSARVKHDIQAAPFIGDVSRHTRSELLELGYDRDKIERLGKDERRLGMQQLSRNSVVDETSDDDSVDHSMDEIEVLECWARVDFNGDGVAELRHIVKAENQLLLNEEATEIPYAYWSPIRMPHRHVGISIFDLLKDLSDIKTALTRQLIDNTFLVNNPRPVVNQNVNLTDLTSVRPGAPIRTSGQPGMDVSWGTVQPIADALLPVISHIDQMRMQRTGVSDMMANMDPDALQNVTKGAFSQASNAAAAKIEMIARMLAEGWKQVGLRMHSLITRHQDKPLTIRIRNKWTPVDPSQWKQRADCTVNVGLGSHNKDQLFQRVMMLGNVLQSAAQAGLVLPPNVYAAAKEGIRALEFRNPEQFITDPASPEFQQHQQQMAQQPDPMVQVEQAKAQAKVQVEQAKLQQRAQAEHARMQADQIIERAKMEAKVMGDAASQQAKDRAAMAQALIQADLTREKMLLDFTAKMAAADAQAKTDLTTAAMNAMHQAEREFPNG
jgi:hypothetical protein